MARNPHNLIRKKPKIGLPSPSEGLDGDISFNISSTGIGLYGKINSRWYKFGHAHDVSSRGKVNKKRSLLKENLAVNELDVDRTVNIGKTAITTNTNRVYSTSSSDTDYLYISSRVFDVISSSDTSKIYIGDIDLQPTWGTTGATISVASADNSSSLHLKILGAGSTAGSHAGSNLYLAPGGSAGGNNGSLYLGHNGTSVVSPYTTNIYGSTITLDCSGDIELNADGGDITFKDDSASLASLSSSGLTINNISAIGSDTDKFLMSDSGVVKYVTGANLRSYIGAGTSSVTLSGSTDNTIATVTGANALAGEANLTFDGTDLSIASTGKVIFGGGDSYILESSADVLDLYAGGSLMLRLTEETGVGNKIDCTTNPVGFTQFEPTYNVTNTIVSFHTYGNKGFVTFGSGNITNMKLYFPSMSGNFVLLVKQDGSGSRTVTNWLAYDNGGSAAAGSSTVKFPGGSNPTLTTAANHVDIISIYWDADNEIAYGVASLDFQD